MRLGVLGPQNGGACLGEGDDHVAHVPVQLQAAQLVEALHPQRRLQPVHHLWRSDGQIRHLQLALQLWSVPCLDTSGIAASASIAFSWSTTHGTGSAMRHCR